MATSPLQMPENTPAGEQGGMLGEMGGQDLIPRGVVTSVHQQPGTGSARSPFCGTGNHGVQRPEQDEASLAPGELSCSRETEP